MNTPVRGAVQQALDLASQCAHGTRFQTDPPRPLAPDRQPASPSAYLTISVDDGHPTDLRTGELLQKYGMKATFYIPGSNPERELMACEQIRQIADEFEVGAHTLSHKPLRRLHDVEAFTEIRDGKAWLEDIVGTAVSCFCYPRGTFNRRTPELVRRAGFLTARTCMFNLNDFPRDPFRWGVSTHGSSHGRAIQFRHALIERNFKGISQFVITHRLARDWVDHFRHAADFVEHYGGIAHLYFHSWEIDANDEWAKLESLLANLSARPAFTRATNGELVAHLSSKAGAQS